MATLGENGHRLPTNSERLPIPARCFFCGREVTEGGAWHGQAWNGMRVCIVVCIRCVHYLGELAAHTFEAQPGYRHGDPAAMEKLNEGYQYGLACARLRRKRSERADQERDIARRNR